TSKASGSEGVHPVAEPLKEVNFTPTAAYSSIIAILAKLKTINLGLIFYGLLPACLIAAFSGGCSSRGPFKAPPLSMGRVERGGRIIHLSSGRELTFDQLIKEVGAKRLVFVGEIHDDPEHHLVQVQILQALMARRGFDAVAMEFFQRIHQVVVDRYMEGELDEKAFLQAVDWEKSWSYDYSLYRPLVLQTRNQGARLLAVNAPGSVVRKVARRGLEALSASERALIARDIDLGNQRHRRFVRRVFESHTHRDLKEFEFFYQAQCVWEETMASNIAESLRHGGPKTVVLCGNGHIIHGFGIPDRVARRLPTDMATILLYPAAGRGELEKQSADYVWLTGGHRLGHPVRPRRKVPGPEQAE
ncbi:MAG: hypothetical protein DRH20_13900, partial [Deltaproteobacteria bacterium]